jgi:hypothetical protein
MRWVVLFVIWIGLLLSNTSYGMQQSSSDEHFKKYVRDRLAAFDNRFDQLFAEMQKITCRMRQCELREERTMRFVHDIMQSLVEFKQLVAHNLVLLDARLSRRYSELLCAVQVIRQRIKHGDGYIEDSE